jgi:anti-sigma factor RsiW
MTRHLGERLSALIDGELSDAQRERVLAHLAKCDGCRQEAAALRLLKRRMHSLGEAAAADALTWRLLALAPASGPGQPADHVRAGRRRYTWSLVAAGVLTAGVGLAAAVFVVGGDRPAGPRVVPAVDVFMVQHAITTGQVPVPAGGVPSPAVSSQAP